MLSGFVTVISWQPVQGVLHLSPKISWAWFQHTCDFSEDQFYRAWMQVCVMFFDKYCFVVVVV